MYHNLTWHMFLKYSSYLSDTWQIYNLEITGVKNSSSVQQMLWNNSSLRGYPAGEQKPPFTNSHCTRNTCVLTTKGSIPGDSWYAWSSRLRDTIQSVPGCGKQTLGTVFVHKLGTKCVPKQIQQSEEWGTVPYSSFRTNKTFLSEVRVPLLSKTHNWVWWNAFFSFKLSPKECG